MMFIFNKVFTRWLPSVSLMLLFYTLFLSLFREYERIIMLSGLLLFFPVIFSGIKTLSEGCDFPFYQFYKRSANKITFIRSSFVITGLGIFVYSEFPLPLLSGLIASILVLSGFAADFLDGYFARREKSGSAMSEWGPWYDAETDALVIFFTCIVLTRFQGIPGLILVPALARYVFAMLFIVFPVPLKAPLWYVWFSKSAAAVLQVVLSLMFVSLILLPENHLLINFQVTFLIPSVSILIIISFLLETWFRLKTIRKIIPSGYRKGIIKSYIIYYLVPFRRMRMYRFYKQFIKKGDLAFDVGAHLGNRTRTFIDLGAAVSSFEPQPVCFSLLEIWFSSHDKVILDSSSIGGECRTAELLLSSLNPTLATLDSQWVKEMEENPLFNKVKWDNKTETKMITLDYAIEKYGIPRFIKIDTEGFEASVLAGLSTAIEQISFEFLPGQAERAEKCLFTLMNLGTYKFNFSQGESMRLYFTKWQSAEEIKSFIRNYPENRQSGDIYAELQKNI